MQEKERYAKMEHRNIIVISTDSGVGKSWFLNRVYDQEQFQESANSLPCTSQIQSKEREIYDPKNNKTFRLVLYDTPALNSSSFAEISRVINHVGFHKIILLFTMTSQVDRKSLKKLFGDHLKNSPELFTFVMNKISTTVQDTQIIEKFNNIKSTLGLSTHDFICIKNGEAIRDVAFKYFLYCEEEYSFNYGNFLSSVSQARQVKIAQINESPRSRTTPMRPNDNQLREASEHLTACHLTTSKYAKIMMALFVALAVPPIALMASGTINVAQAIYYLGAYFFIFVLSQMLFVYKLARKMETQIKYNDSLLEDGLLGSNATPSTVRSTRILHKD